MGYSGTTQFNLTVDEFIEQATRKIGGDPISGVEAFDAAKQAFNLLLIDLENKGVPLSKLELIEVTCSTSQASYTLSSDTVDVLDAVLRRNNRDYPMESISLFEYNAITNKAQTGKPSQYTMDRERDAPIITIFPTYVPASVSTSTTPDTLRLWTSKRIQDISALNQNVDLPYRYTPALVFGLAWFMAFGRPNVTKEKRDELKLEYGEFLMTAQEEDRERTSFIARPQIARVLK
jgi:hypothetical protein